MSNLHLYNFCKYCFRDTHSSNPTTTP